MHCPACDRPAIARPGGMWCRWCRHYVYSMVKPDGTTAIVPYVNKLTL